MQLEFTNVTEKKITTVGRSSWGSGLWVGLWRKEAISAGVQICCLRDRQKWVWITCLISDVVWHWVSYLIFLSFSFLICKIQKTHHSVMKIIYDNMVIDGGAKLFQWEKRKTFQQMVLEKWISIWGENELRPLQWSMYKS